MIRNNAGPLQDIAEVSLRCAVLLALRRPLGRQFDNVQLRPPDLAIGEGQTCALDADGPLDDVQPRAGIHQSLHEAEVTSGYSFGWSQLDY